MPSIDISATANIHSLYNENQGWLHGWLRKKLGCTEQASDVVQDTFVRVLQHKENTGVLPEILEPRAYLTTVAGRLIYDIFRRQALEVAYIEALSKLPEQYISSPEELLLIRQSLFELDEILNNLKPIVREVFLLSQLKGLTYTAIAQQLLVSERSVKRYMATAFEECIMVMT